ncbi:MAG: riboflavin synthase, partial [Aeoliella sp.]
MFTGLVQSLAEVANLVSEPGGIRVLVREPNIAARANVGASIAVNGCCLTVVDVNGAEIAFQA